MFLARQSIIKLLASLSILWANTGHASVSERDAKSYFRFLSRINSASPLEHGGSHGALGFGLGMGFSVYHPAVSAQIMREHWRSPSQQGFKNKASAQRLVLPKFYLYKGLPNSLDIGLAVAQDVNTKARVWSGYGQWTPIEGFALPSIAIRGGFSRCMGLATTDASSLSLDGVLSLSLIHNLTLPTTPYV